MHTKCCACVGHVLGGNLESEKCKMKQHFVDAVYEHFAGAISGFGTHSHAHTQRIIELQTLINAKARHAESLQKKIRAEKQFNKQMELNGEARKIKREIAELKRKWKGCKGEVRICFSLAVLSAI